MDKKFYVIYKITRENCVKVQTNESTYKKQRKWSHIRQTNKIAQEKYMERLKSRKIQKQFIQGRIHKNKAKFIITLLNSYTIPPSIIIFNTKNTLKIFTFHSISAIQGRREKRKRHKKLTIQYSKVISSILFV